MGTVQCVENPDQSGVYVYFPVNRKRRLFPFAMFHSSSYSSTSNKPCIDSLAISSLAILPLIKPVPTVDPLIPLFLQQKSPSVLFAGDKNNQIVLSFILYHC